MPHPTRAGRRLASFIVFGFLPGLASAQSSAVHDGDTAWLLTSTALVLFMTLPGLAAFYGGLVRQKNVLSVLMQCFALCCIVSVLWLMFGYSISFTGDGALIGNIGTVHS